MPRAIHPIVACALAAGTLLAAGAAAQEGGPARFGFGTPATAEQIRAWDIDAGPDGEGLPPGSGTAAEGEAIYAAQCAACHGVNLEGVPATGGETLIGGRGSLAGAAPLKTVESFWPYAPTLFDYIGRAMPFNAPGSLGADEVYAVSAYILFRAGLFSREAVLNAQTLPQVRMPNREGFRPDERPDTPR